MSNIRDEKIAFKEFNRKQHFFIFYSFAILVDLTVLNLFSQYWDNVYIDNFTTSLLVAILLQLLLQITVKIEHHVSNYFKKKEGLQAKILRGLSVWGILFVSKLIILQAIQLLFGESIIFSGAIHGLVAFIVVVVAIIIAEQTIIKINKSLGDN